MIDVAVFVANLRLAVPVVAADRAHDERTSLFVRVAVDGAAGWAECPASSTPGVDATEPELLAAFRAMDVAADGPARHAGARRAAVGAVDTALLDARLRAEGRSLCDELAVSVRSVGFAGVVGIDDPDAAAARAVALVAGGATRVRVKVGPASGTAAIRAVLDAVSVPVVADANGSFDPGRPSALDELVGLPIAWLEQPFAPGHPEATRALAGAGTRLGADESVTDLGALERLVRDGHVEVVCVKPSRVGLRLARAIVGRARSAGLSAYVGGFFEAGLGRASLGALSAAAADLDGDVVAPSAYLVDDPCHLAPPVDNRQPLYAGPGTGPVPDMSALTRRLTLRVAQEPHSPPP